VVNGDTKRAGGLWSWQGCDSGQLESWSQGDKAFPVLDTMGTGSTANINATYVTTNLMSRNNWHWSRIAGVAYNYFWGSDVGFGVGSIMPYHVYGLELPVRGSGLGGNHNIGYTWVGWPGKTLSSGEKTYIGTSMIGVVDGDMGNGVNMYARTMDNVDITPFVDRGEFVTRTDDYTSTSSSSKWQYIVDGFNYAEPRYEYKYDESGSYYNGVPENLIVMPKGDELADWMRKPAWETYGYGSTIPTLALFYLIPILERLGYGTVTYEGGWRDTSNSLNMGSSAAGWTMVAPMLEEYFAAHPHSKHLAPGDAYDFSGLSTATQTGRNRVVRAMNEYIHEHGMRVLAWVQDSLVPNAQITSGRVPQQWGVRNFTDTGRNGSYGCTGNPEFINDYTTFFCELMFGDGTRELAFDGLKGDSFWGMDRCYGTGHGHDGDPDAPIRNYGLYFKNIYNKANYIRGATEYVGGPVVDVEKMASIKQCMCGRVMDYFVFTGVNRPISGDHSGTKQNRQANRIWRGFYGWDVPMSSDHHDLDMRDDEMFRPPLENIGEFDYANILGTGILFESKTRLNLHAYHNAASERSSLMTWPGEPNYKNRWPDFTPSNGTGSSSNLPWANGAIKWGAAVKYYGLYHDLGTSQSKMIDNLYKYAVDYPETYALELMDRNPATGALTPKPVSERIYSFYATSFPIEADDPRLRNADGTGGTWTAVPCRYYREMMVTNADAFPRSFDPWNSVDKGIENTTADIQAGIPFTFKYEGPIEIRGLKANTAYCLSDVETGEKLLKTSDASGLIKFDTVFKNSVIYHVTEAVTGSVSGHVYDGAGDIQSGATITLYDENGNRMFWDTASDMDGAYSFPVVPAGRYYIVHTFPKGYVQPLSGTAAVPNNDSRYEGFTPVNMDYFTDVYEYVSQPFVVGGGAVTRDLGPNVSYYSASVLADPESDIDKNIEFALTLRGAENVLTFEAEVTVDGNMLAGVGVEALNGFTVMNDIFWRYAGNGMWQGTVTLAYKAGEDEGFTGLGPTDIAKFIFAPRGVGDTALTLTGVKSAGLVGENTQYLDVEVVWGEAVTNIDQRVFSKYDLNRDNKVDALDLGIMLLYCGFSENSPGWDVLVKVNDSRGKPVTASMCDVNGDGVIDMLDLLDLFIHYTK
ncbi:MAG: dockerin type I domain-containing protein, partial [Clostridiales bacterium]|nr:dockerin type I domain-containing protein [Clostridiales bacterium]